MNAAEQAVLKKYCSARVQRSGSVLTNQCHNAYFKTVDGKDYCAIHEPEAVERRAKKLQQKHADDAKRRIAKFTRETGRRELVDAAKRLVFAYDRIGEDCVIGDSEFKVALKAVRAAIKKAETF